MDQVLQTGKHQIEPFSLMSSEDERTGEDSWFSGGHRCPRPGLSLAWACALQDRLFWLWLQRLVADTPCHSVSSCPWGRGTPTSLTFRNGSSRVGWHWAGVHPTMTPPTDPRSSRAKEAHARPPLSPSQLTAAPALAEVCAENTLREMQGQGQGHTARVQRRPGQNPALPEHETPRARVPSLLVATGLGPGAAGAGHALHGAGPGPPAWAAGGQRAGGG